MLKIGIYDLFSKVVVIGAIVLELDSTSLGLNTACKTHWRKVKGYLVQNGPKYYRE